MKALIGRHSDGWSTRGFVARTEDGRTLTATDAIALAQKLRAAGVTEVQIAGTDEGDWSLSTAQGQSLLQAWQQSEG